MLTLAFYKFKFYPSKRTQNLFLTKYDRQWPCSPSDELCAGACQTGEQRDVTPASAQKVVLPPQKLWHRKKMLEPFEPGSHLPQFFSKEEGSLISCKKDGIILPDWTIQTASLNNELLIKQKHQHTSMSHRLSLHCTITDQQKRCKHVSNLPVAVGKLSSGDDCGIEAPAIDWHLTICCFTCIIGGRVFTASWCIFLFAPRKCEPCCTDLHLATTAAWLRDKLAIVTPAVEGRSQRSSRWKHTNTLQNSNNHTTSLSSTTLHFFIFLKCTISKNTTEVLLVEMRAKHMLISYMQAS